MGVYTSILIFQKPRQVNDPELGSLFAVLCLLRLLWEVKVVCFSPLTSSLTSSSFGKGAFAVPVYFCKIIPFTREEFIILMYVTERAHFFCVTRLTKRVVQVVKWEQ